MGHNGGPPLDDDEEDQKAALERSIFEQLKDLSVEEILRQGQKDLFLHLVTKVRAGTANHQEASILRNILKDNGLTLGIPPEKPAETEAPMDLPVFEDPTY